MPLSAKDREWLGTFLYPLLRKITCIQESSESSNIESRPVCVTSGADCLRAYAVTEITSTATTILRVEGVDGIEVEDYVIVNCTCECIDVVA